MEVGQVMEVWDDVETDAESSDVSSGAEDAAVQEFESGSSDEDITDHPSTSAGPSSRPSARSTRRAAEYSWREVTESK
jgi:hypothetical protein